MGKRIVLKGSHAFNINKKGGLTLPFRKMIGEHYINRHPDFSLEESIPKLWLIENPEFPSLLGFIYPDIAKDYQKITGHSSTIYKAPSLTLAKQQLHALEIENTPAKAYALGSGLLFNIVSGALLTKYEELIKKQAEIAMKNPKFSSLTL